RAATPASFAPLSLHDALPICQLRWTGPDKGATHLATAAVVNAVWDLWAKAEGKPVWRLVADLSPQEFVRLIDFRYLTDALTPEQDRKSTRLNSSHVKISYAVF